MYLRKFLDIPTKNLWIFARKPSDFHKKFYEFLGFRSIREGQTVGFIQKS